MTSRPGPSIPMSEAVSCADCRVVFSIREVACPKCAALTGIAPVESTRASAEIGRLRDVIDMNRAAFLQIARGLHSSEFKVRVATKALDYINKAMKSETASAGTETASRKAVN